MAIKFGPHSLTSDQTHHTAQFDHMAEGWERWTVTWLPGREVGRNQAITAMVLAESLGWKATQISWPLVDCLAAELELTGAEVFNLVRMGGRPSNGDTQPGT